MTASQLTNPAANNRYGTDRYLTTLNARIGSGVTGIARWFERKAAIARLEEMDDRLLRDVGIRRAQIREVVNQPY